jgi:hypothetical protein
MPSTYFDVTPQVIEQLFRTGNEVHSRVVEGIPEGTRIVKVETPQYFDPNIREGECGQFIRFWLEGPNLKPGGIHITVEAIKP